VSPAERDRREKNTMGLILVILLVLLLIGALPNWGYSRSWGYRPSGILGIVLIIVVVLLLTGRL
jgi:uncharacterized protein DUF3309